ncbi:type II toxin-antitoxin system RelE/ParE family toxin [candidate division KSB1 bacterium]|nr:type II toxin-antitoxin system RelE/ParE family toxin [candidate division KSB1 bacterium]
MTISWTREALRQLTAIEKFIAGNNPARAETFVNNLVEHGELIAQNPWIGRIVPELANPDIREIIVKKYRLVYKIEKEKIVILTVFEGHKL